MLIVKLNTEYRGVKDTATSNAKAAAQSKAQQASASSNALALPGIKTLLTFKIFLTFW